MWYICVCVCLYTKMHANNDYYWASSSEVSAFVIMSGACYQSCCNRVNQSKPSRRLGSAQLVCPFLRILRAKFTRKSQTDTKSVPTNPATQSNWKLLIRCSGFKGKATGKVEAKSVRLSLARLTWFLSGFIESLVSSEAINWNRLTRPLRWHDSPLIRWTPSIDRPKLCVSYDTKVSLRSSSMRPSEVELEHDLMQTQERPQADSIRSLKLYNGERSRLPAFRYSSAQSVSH